ncbi:MAG: type II CAAX endopeptidase family protein [Ignavibacteriota bacterium]
MIDEQPPVTPPAPPPERVPFWGYADVALMLGLSLPCIFVGVGFVRLLAWLGHFHLAVGVESVLAFLVGYALIFLSLKVIFRVQYDRPFWSSLGWTEKGVSAFQCVIYGCATLFLVSGVARLVHAPPAEGPITEMMKDHTSLIVMAIFGTTVAPVAEELAFRGFVQPLLVRNLGAIGGVALTSAFFGGLHYSEYGESWRSALLIAVAGAAFGSMRQLTGSTLASAIMHASFNGLQFAALLISPK